MERLGEGYFSWRIENVFLFVGVAMCKLRQKNCRQPLISASTLAA
jgi:hypothetical protein